MTLTHLSFEGRDFQFDLDGMLVGQYLFEQIFNKREYEAVEGFEIRPGDTVVDIGGNVGLFSSYAAIKAGPSGRVFSYEPAASNAERFRRNMELNGLANVKLTQKGLSDAEGTATLYKPHDEGAYSLFESNASLYTRGEGYQGQTETIHLTTLARVFEDNAIDHCHYLKIDCEGPELMILSAAPESLFARIDRMAIEWHPNVKVTDLESLLVARGYTTARRHERNKNSDPALNMGTLFAWKK